MLPLGAYSGLNFFRVVFNLNNLIYNETMIRKKSLSKCMLQNIINCSRSTAFYIS